MSIISSACFGANSLFPPNKLSVAIIKRKNDIEDKLVVCKDLNKYNKEQIKALVEFQEIFFESRILMSNEK